MAGGGPSPTVVCVLGMSRTGTSLTTRLLSLAGVYLGPEDELLGKDLHQLAEEGDSVLARARDTNPEGFWEHYRIMRLNERILRKLDGNWRDPPKMLNPGWEQSAELDPEREEARALLAESFDGEELWGWKDPRNSITLPFWQQLIPEMRCVVCLRNPVDVAASLERRDGIEFEHAARLWAAYTSHAMVNSRTGPRLLVPFESHFEDPRGTADRLAAFVGREGAFEEAGAQRELEAAVDERLWRHRTPPEEAQRDPRIMPGVVVIQHATEQLVGRSGADANA